MGFAFASLVGVCQLAAPNAIAATSSASFCHDSAQLQSWIEQNFFPGIDQYQLPAANVHATAQFDAAYLHGLVAGAPAAIRADLADWANFTQQVAAGAEPAELARNAPAARAAALRVTQWLASKDGCNDFREATTPSPAHHSGINPLIWIIGGIVLAFAFVSALFGSRTTSSRPATGTSPPAGSSSSLTNSSSSFKAPSATCANCGGTGRTTCPTCGGRRNIDGRPCATCAGQGGFPCQSCNGTGRQRQ